MLPAGLSLVGAAAGVWSQAAVIGDSRHAGAAAAASARGAPSETRASAAADPSAALINHPYPIFGAKDHDFIDFDEDLQSKDIVNTVKDGYDDIQLVKRYSTAGLGPSQGRHANLNTIRIVARETGKSIESDRHDDLSARRWCRRSSPPSPAAVSSRCATRPCIIAMSRRVRR